MALGLHIGSVYAIYSIPHLPFTLSRSIPSRRENHRLCSYGREKFLVIRCRLGSPWRCRGGLFGWLHRRRTATCLWKRGEIVRSGGSG